MPAMPAIMMIAIQLIGTGHAAVPELPFTPQEVYGLIKKRWNHDSSIRCARQQKDTCDREQ
jgi:hypothetical protein